jgi:glycyl-tRNA synthetase beta chain
VEREAAIRQGLKECCAKAGLTLVEDEALVSICANLVEWPGVLAGEFDTRYLGLPEAIIITALREHQRIFAARSADGRLAPAFLAVTNGTRKNLDGVREGNAQVLKARLEDARFFVEEDRKRPLESYLEDLKTVLWLEGMGSVYDKSERLRVLAEWLCIHLRPEAKVESARAASLAKADLASHVVGEKEYTSLQGVMGGLYALASGEGEAVSQAITEHYKPAFSGDAIPSTPAGQMVALADKLDNLVGCFAAGLIPSGSQDPYALRRQAAGVVAILAAQPADLSLRGALEFTLNLHRNLARDSAKLDPKAFAWLTDPAQAQALLGKLQDFLKARLEAALLEAGHSQDRVAAVLARRHDLVREAMARAKALDLLVQRDDFDLASQAFSRVTNILAKAGEVVPVDASLLTDGPEKLLHERFLAVRPNAERACQQGRFDLAFEELSGLRSAIDAYFAEVMVMAEDPRIRANRLSFLAQVAGTINLIADFTKLAKR